MLIGILIVLVIICAVLLLSRIKLVTSMTFNQETQYIWIACYFYGIRLLTRSIDLAEEGAGQEQSVDETVSQLHRVSQNGIQRIKDVQDIVTLVLARLRFHRISWKTEIGAGQAHTTGMAAGGIWGTKGTVIGLLSAKSHFDCHPTLMVTPLYNQYRVNSVFDCMISMRIGQAIYAIVKITRKSSVKDEATI